MLSGSGLNSASCTHRATWICWQFAGHAVRNSHRESGHELPDFALAERAVHMGFLVHHQFVKGVFTVFAVIFEDWHNNPPHSLGIMNIIITQVSNGKGHGEKASVTRRNGDTGIRGQKSDDRNSYVGAAFSRDHAIS